MTIYFRIFLAVVGVLAVSILLPMLMIALIMMLALTLVAHACGLEVKVVDSKTKRVVGYWRRFKYYPAQSGEDYPHEYTRSTM